MLDYAHLVAGLAGGFISTAAVHPLDLLKIRCAVNEGNLKVRPEFKSYAHVARSILSERSIFGLYQGITPNLAGSTISWGVYFLLYNYFKDLIRASLNLDTLHARHNLSAGLLAGNITLLITNPIWVAKTRLCLQYESQPASYGGFIDVLRKTFLTEGIRGLYKGFLPGVIGTSHGALQFMAYEELKTNFGTSEPRVSEHLSFAALSKIFAVCSTYPYQVVRARLQDQHANYAGVFDVVRKTWRREGILGFYKGLLPSMLRVTPATCVTFVVYEKVSHFLIQARGVQ
ncbi:hypothetical protein M514_01436 [Trichuris suis]|uniref:Mitochondrial folate transporter/carrier n=1 Tax=Trichuris suis TaxID=68888 RepID=A0A085MKM0_9BILA|nr:hypothetical protein M513_01436 [Trichuris suis]KFD65513.1 hypothetical protein M514_01436 [Trichuris suis]KHJ49455.1 hypothetical protein D918_00582 [Trichuris suis]